MTTAIKIPDMPSGLTLTVDVVNTTSLAVVETVAMTFASDVYSGNITGGLAGQYLFRLKASGSIIGSRRRTIAATAGPFILDEASEAAAIQVVGARVVTITVTDGTDPLENAKVRLTAGAVSEAKITNASGVAVFALDDATYAVSITMSGHGGEVATLVVSGTTSHTYPLTANSFDPPTLPDTAIGYLVLLDESSAGEIGKPVTVQLIAGPGTAGYGLDEKPITVNSIAAAGDNPDGYVEFPSLRIGATYSIWRGGSVSSSPVSVFATRSSSSPGTFVVPDAERFLLPEIKGLDAT